MAKFSFHIILVAFAFYESLATSEATIATNADFDHYKLLHLNKKLELQCNVSSRVDLVHGNVTWTKNGIEVTNEDGITVAPFSLLIKKATLQDVGNYSCKTQHKLNGGQVIDLLQNLTVIAAPMVKLPREVVVVEGEKLLLNCSANGYPLPTVFWKFENTSIAESTDHITLMTEKGVLNSVLIIDTVVAEDRGTFYCLASNLAGSNVQAKVYVRVKDKYAALWPFLGICAEVFILCTIILIYEKRRNKTELEESDTDQSPEQKNSGDGGKDSELRQRK